MNTPIRRWPRVAAVVACAGLGAALLVPAAGAIAEPAFVSDDFSSGLDRDLWTVDHVPDGTTISTSGQGTSDAYLTIEVPAGADHNPWTRADVPRVGQPIDSTAVSMDAKFDSIPTVTNQMQGLLFVRDDATFVRFGVYRSASGLRLFASTTIDGAPVKRLDKALPELSQVVVRVSRDGDRWRYSWSEDGASWTTGGTFTQAVDVTEVGPYAGTAGGSSAPAYRADVDYVFETTTPIVTEDGGGEPAPEPDPTGSPTATPEPEPTATATSSPAPTPTQDPTPAPTTPEPSPIPDPAPTSSPDPTEPAEPDPDPTAPAEPDPEPTAPAEPDPEPLGTGTVTSDDFASGALDPGTWSVVDPTGDGVVTLTGAGTSDAWLTIGVPAGRDHNPWARADAPRAVQSVDDTNMSVEVGFDSIPTQVDQMQGILFLQDDATFTRFDIHRKADGIKLFASSTVAGKGTSRLSRTLTGIDSGVYLRVDRVGDTWTLRWSPDGSTWISAVTFTQAMTVQTVGPYAGNAGGSAAAAYTAAVDYVFDPAAPIDPEDGSTTPPPEPTPTPTPTPDPAPTTPTPPPGPGGGPLVSDDFSGPTLDTELWEATDPIGGAVVAPTGTGTQDTRLAIALPAGTSRDAWAANDATRVLQPITDGDVEIEAKFDSIPREQFQDQGLIVQASPNRWLRFGTYSDGSSVYAFAASTTGTTSTKIMKKRITANGPAIWVRVTRVGDAWTFRTSTNGTSWTTIGASTQSLDVTAAGPYAGTTGPNPAWTALVDYVFDSAAPIEPEDGGAPPDTTPPAVADVSITPGSHSLSVGWSTDEVATGVVEVALAGTNTWSWSADTATPGLDHAVTVTGLTAETAYQVRVRATDLASNTSTSATHAATTTTSDGPVIDAWYGDTQRFGGRGLTQPSVNVLGNVSDGDGIQSLRYSLNGAPSQALSMGPNLRRLQYEGDFNADIRYTDLDVGSNAVTITAIDGIGEVTQKTVTLIREATSPPALPFVTEWTAQSPLTEQATVVDGRWTVGGSGVRVAPGATGYDRLITVGDSSWTDYEVTVPFTVHGIGPGAGSPKSNEPMVGIGLRWQGHQIVDSTQPAWGYKSIGAYAWYRWFDPPRMELLGDGAIVRGRKDAPLQLGQPYVFKARADTVGSQTTYSMKMFPAGSAEPANWDLTYTGSGPDSGSVVLIAHHTDVTFGDVAVTPLP